MSRGCRTRRPSFRFELAFPFLAPQCILINVHKTFSAHSSSKTKVKLWTRKRMRNPAEGAKAAGLSVPRPRHQDVGS